MYPQYQLTPTASPWQPYGQMPQPQQGTPIEGVRWVNSVDEVNATTIGFGQSALFMFSGEDAFAVKSVDASGMPTVKVFDFKERPMSSPVVVDPSQYVTKEEFDNLRRMYEQLAQPASATAAATAPQPAAEPAAPAVAAAGQGAAVQPGGGNGVDF